MRSNLISPRVGSDAAGDRQSALKHLDAHLFPLGAQLTLSSRHSRHAAEGKWWNAWWRCHPIGIRAAVRHASTQFVMEKVLDVPAEAFRPAPKVESAGGAHAAAAA